MPDPDGHELSFARQQPDELIGGEEKLAEVFVQYPVGHVVPGMGFPEQEQPVGCGSG
jgi:hypothetical protein